MSSRSAKIFAALKTLQTAGEQENTSPRGFRRDYKPLELDSSALVGSPESIVTEVSNFQEEIEDKGRHSPRKLTELQRIKASPSVSNQNLLFGEEVVNNILCENSDDSVEDPNYENTDNNDTSEDSSSSAKLQEEQNVVPISDTNLMQSQKGRKRKRSPATWKCNIRQQKRLSGVEYISKNKTLMAAKSLGSPCKNTCRYKCNTNITQEIRQDIFEKFWSPSKTIDHKRQFVASSVQLADIKRRRERTGERANKKSSNKKFNLTVDNQRVDVCKTFFLSTLGISQTFVSTALSKKGSGGMVESDKRGKKIPPNKISAEIKDSIRNHILKFPTIESHYSRERSSKRYLESSLNIARMYELYKEELVDKKIPEPDIPKLWLYSEIFNTEFNYSFKLPENDTCDQYDKYLVKLKESLNIDERKSIQTEYDGHLNEASKRYSLKSQDKENAKINKKLKIIMVDLEMCLPTPSLTNAQSFYSLKLWTFNYTIKDIQKNRTTCCMWDESVAGRGGNEMASCLLKWAISNIDESVEELTIWSDNCPSQNRNLNSILAYFSILNFIPTLKVLNHKYLLRGHTHLEVDSDHSVIERERKKMNKFQIMTPWDWQQLVRLASNKNPFLVINMETNDFKNFISLIEGSNAPFLHRKKYESGKDFKISQQVHIQVRSEQQGKVFCKSDFGQTDFEFLDLNRVSRRAHFPEEIPTIRSGPKPISEKKYKDLQSLLQWVPTVFHPFYQNMSQTDKNNEDVDN